MKDTILILGKIAFVCLFAGGMMYFGTRLSEFAWERPPIEISISLKDEDESGSTD